MSVVYPINNILETRVLLADDEARQRLEEARAEIAHGDYVTSDEMARLMEQRRVPWLSGTAA